MNPYQILGIPEDSSADYIKQKYRILAQQLHPDKQEGNEEKFKEIKLAYEILIDPERRKLYDDTGKIDVDNTIRSESFHMLNQILERITQQTNPDFDDLILKMKLEVNDIKNNLESDIKVCKKLISDLNKSIPKIKLKNKKKENILQVFANQLLEKREQELKSFTRKIEICKTMHEILDEYHFSSGDWLFQLNNQS